MSNSVNFHFHLRELNSPSESHCCENDGPTNLMVYICQDFCTYCLTKTSYIVASNLFSLILVLMELSTRTDPEGLLFVLSKLLIWVCKCKNYTSSLKCLHPAVTWKVRGWLVRQLRTTPGIPQQHE